MNVELRIEEVVLHGFPPGNHHRIGDAAERELSRLFSERGVPPSLARGGDAPYLNAGTFEMNLDLTPDMLGARVAHSLYERITG